MARLADCGRSGGGTGLAKPSDHAYNPAMRGSILWRRTMIESKPVSADRVEVIKKELAERMEREQGIRQKLHELLQNKITSQELKDHPIVKEMNTIDKANEAYLIAITAECGWPDAQRFGARAAQAAFLIVQHSGNVELMSDALPCIEADARAKRIHGDQYALLYDRLNLRLHGKQRYGSQLTTAPDGSFSLDPLEDPDKVEELRKELGMEPLAQYLERFKRK
jgi:hypothetical protein